MGASRRPRLPRTTCTTQRDPHGLLPVQLASRRVPPRGPPTPVSSVALRVPHRCHRLPEQLAPAPLGAIQLFALPLGHVPAALDSMAPSEVIRCLDDGSMLGRLVVALMREGRALWMDPRIIVILLSSKIRMSRSGKTGSTDATDQWNLSTRFTYSYRLVSIVPRMPWELVSRHDSMRTSNRQTILC